MSDLSEYFSEMMRGGSNKVAAPQTAIFSSGPVEQVLAASAVNNPFAGARAFGAQMRDRAAELRYLQALHGTNMQSGELSRALASGEALSKLREAAIPHMGIQNMPGLLSRIFGDAMSQEDTARAGIASNVGIANTASEALKRTAESGLDTSDQYNAHMMELGAMPGYPREPLQSGQDGAYVLRTLLNGSQVRVPVTKEVGLGLLQGEPLPPAQSTTAGTSDADLTRVAMDPTMKASAPEAAPPSEKPTNSSSDRTLQQFKVFFSKGTHGKILNVTTDVPKQTHTVLVQRPNGSKEVYVIVPGPKGLTGPFAPAKE